MTNAPAPSPAVRQRIPGRYWRIAALSGMASYLDSGIIVGISVSLAVWAQAYDMSVWMLGSISAILTVCIAIGSMFGGRLADLFGRRLVYGIDIAVYAAGAVVIILAPNATVLFVGVLVAGLAAGADLPTSLAVVSDAVPVWARGRLISFTQVMWTIGIAVAIGLGLATSHMGLLGTKIVIGQLAVAAVVTWILRNRTHMEDHSDEEQAVETEVAAAEVPHSVALRTLLAPTVLVPMALTFGFYVFWGIAANTFGQFGTYFLVTVSGASQSVATLIGLVFVPVGIVTALLFTRIADSKWRDRIFVIAAVFQIIAFAVGAVSGGATIAAMIVFYLIYNISNPFAGEANYKVWSQLLFPPRTRGTAQGLTYAIARGVFAVVALFTPALLAWNADVLLWGLVGCIVASSIFGVVIARWLVPNAPAVVIAGLEAGSGPSPISSVVPVVKAPRRQRSGTRK
ncbi:inositol transporter-like SP family MFS transporter [Curtobacterium pusillum]|uniref:Inositol transporter-like SP family MFS transporter n=1 Tax=Curtobacterium pusillum TaxID=69373 RepID=A0AAW3SYD9_9MICO|nr:MFS transporter [Curtobacterium pusillum]MBA8988874.1 inositol transporter-like SP family MFS transporter [Curtobacterium pusillum]